MFNFNDHIKGACSTGPGWRAEMKALSWKARRSGPLYCSPACGGKCTWAAYTRANASAAALAKRLGIGWKPRVWENLGWHYEVLDSSKILRVSRYGDTYTAAILNGTLVSRGKTPEIVVANVIRDVIRKARKEVLWLNSLIASITTETGKKGK